MPKFCSECGRAIRMPFSDEAAELFVKLCNQLDVSPDVVRGPDTFREAVRKRWVVCYMMWRGGIARIEIARAVNRNLENAARGIRNVANGLEGPKAEDWEKLVSLAKGDNKARGDNDDAPAELVRMVVQERTGLELPSASTLGAVLHPETWD